MVISNAEMPGKEKLRFCLESTLLYVNEDDMNIYSLQDYAIYALMVLCIIDFKEVKQENLNISSKLFKIEKNLFSVLQQFLMFTPSVVPICQVKKYCVWKKWIFDFQ